MNTSSNIPSDEDLSAMIGAATQAEVARQLGEAHVARIEAGQAAGAFQAQARALAGALDAETQAHALTKGEQAASLLVIAHLRAKLPTDDPDYAAPPEPHAVEHPEEDPGNPGSAAMLHAPGAPAAHPDAPGADAALDHAP